MITRRKFFSGLAAVGGGALVAQLPTKALGEVANSDLSTAQTAQTSSDSSGYTPMTVMDGATLPWKMVGGVKVFHLIAQEFEHEFLPGLKAKCWGYNGRTPGPLIEAVEGDKVRIYVTNHLPEPTTAHWHGIFLPNGMDGVPGLTQPPIPPGETFKYEFTLRQHGTFMYHPHFDGMWQEAFGMMGMFVVHPKNRIGKKIDRDFSIMLSEWKIVPGTTRPVPTEMTDYNTFTMNGKSFPGTSPLVVKKGERVRIRIGNLSAMDHHPIHLHGYAFKVVATDGGEIESSAQWPGTTVLVPVGTTRVVEFVADAEGDWLMHCHMSHHMMNQMGHGFPNLAGIDPGKLDEKVRKILPHYMTMSENGMGNMGEMRMETPSNSVPMRGERGQFSYLPFGGMLTVFKVRENLANYEDPGWYKNPAGTVVKSASKEEMKRDIG